MGKDSTLKTIVVASLLCVVCSVLVSTAAVKLRPIQEENKKLDIKKKLLYTAGLIETEQVSPEAVEEAFKNVTAQVIDLETGKVDTSINPNEYDQKKASKNPDESVKLKQSDDLGKIKKRAKKAKAYMVMNGGEVSQIVLPIHGKGLWSTMYGFISLDKDTKTVKGINFYAHGETPGLGGEVDNPRWKAQWAGKIALDDSYTPAIKVIKGSVDSSTPNGETKIDGLSGATITSNGVQGLVNFWLGKEGFGPFLTNFRNGSLQ